LKAIPTLQTVDSFETTITVVYAQAYELANSDHRHLLNWLEHKKANSFIFKGLCFPLNDFTRDDWHSTSFTTNVAESAHAFAQQYGKHLSLVGAVQQSERIDSQFFDVRRNVSRFGVSASYGNKSVTGRTAKNLTRQKGRATKARKALEKKNEKGGTNLTSENVEEVIDRFVNSDAFTKIMEGRKDAKESS